jgi:hypothetical protein
MNENSNVVRLRHPYEIDDPLTNILRSGARQLLAQAIELEAEAFLAEMKGFRLADGETVLSGTVMEPNARSRRGSVLSRLPG